MRHEHLLEPTQNPTIERASEEGRLIDAASVTLSLREATEADQAFITALFRSTRADLVALGDDPMISQLIALQQRIHEQGQRQHFPGARHLLLCSDGQPVGRLVLDIDAQRYYIVDVAVLPEVRRQGKARWLLRWVQRQAAGAGLPVRLQVQRFNDPALRLYAGCGFQASEATDVSVFMAWQGPS